MQKYFSEMSIFGLIWNQIIVCSTFAEKSVKIHEVKKTDNLINLPDIPFTSAEAAQYKIDWAPSTGYLKKIKPIIFQQNWENNEVCRKKLVCVKPGNAIFIVTLLNSCWTFDFMWLYGFYLFLVLSSSAFATVYTEDHVKRRKIWKHKNYLSSSALNWNK